MPTPAIQTLINDAQQVLNLDSISAVRSVVAVSLANANTGTPLNPNLTTQQLWNEFYQVVTRSKSDIESIIANQLMKFLYSPPAPGGVGANKQVIFNDNGILAGDAGLTYDKATDSLTISGDLTVDTSTLKVDSANNRVGIKQASPSHPFQIGTTDLILDATGNVGIGVQPSAWASIYRTVELPNGSSVWGQTDIPQLNIQTNAFLNSSFAWIYKTTAAASNYRLYDGQHLWFTASSGTAGNPITTFGTAKMTLDASGRLLVGPTSANTSGGVLQLSSGITFPATQVASADANTLDDYEEGTWTPTISAGSGTPTTVTVNLAKYTKVGRLVSLEIDISIVNIGTASGLFLISIPFTSGSDLNVGALRDVGATAYMGQLFAASSSQISASFYNNATVWVNGYRIRGTYIYTV